MRKFKIGDRVQSWSEGFGLVFGTVVDLLPESGARGMMAGQMVPIPYSSPMIRLRLDNGSFGDVDPEATTLASNPQLGE